MKRRYTQQRAALMFNREDFLNEVKLRKYIRHLLAEKKQLNADNLEFRKHVRHLIAEEELKEAKAKVVPYDSTGISVLADVIKKVVPICREDYFSLTTSRAQRKSFRAHIINAIKNSLAPIRSMQTGGGSEMSTPELPITPANSPDIDPTSLQEAEDMISSQELEKDQQEASSEEDDERFIDVDNDGKPDQEAEETDEFGIPGEDGTGRNMALQTFRKIEKTIDDSYLLLDQDDDREDFYDYIIANFKLYFDRWEDELQSSVNEPESKV
jgi:hypothetical protein